MSMMAEQNPMLRYVSEPTEEELRAANSPTEQIMNGLTWSILIVCLAFWAIVGALFWVPMLLRTMFRFSLALVGAMLAGKKPERAARMLREAVSFYRRGFQVATEVVVKQDLEQPAQPTRKGEDVGLQGMALLNEITWVVLIWYVILLFMGAIETTPMDMWLWLYHMDWSEAVVRPAAEFLRGFVGIGVR